ncbi:MAG: response regulator [Polyangiaceae bacterium]
MTSKRLVFVGPTEGHATRLRRVLRATARGSDEWTVVRCSDPQQALDELSQAPTDVVVSELELAGMDGPTFLEKVKRMNPSSVRLAITQSGDARQGVAAIQSAQQVLRPSCSDEFLGEMIHRTERLHRFVGNETVRSVVGGLDRLPSVPKTYWALMRAAGRPKTSIADLARIVESDPAMSAKVLHLINSAFFGLARRVTSIHQAVSLLGIDLLKGLVLSAHVFATFEEVKLPGFSLDLFQEYSIRIANLAKRFITTSPEREAAFTAGLVHDLGKLVVAIRFPEQFARITRRASTAPMPYHEVERAHIAATHAELGGYLLGVWGLPFEIVEAVGYHHEPMLALGPNSNTDLSILAAVHTADSLFGIVTCGEPEERLDRIFLERAGLLQHLPEWRRLTEEEAARIH